MMDTIFLKLLNMSITASWLILAVIVLRILLKKAPKAIGCILWAMVGIRLVCPFSFESILSLIPSAEALPQKIIDGHSFDVNTGIHVIDTPINEYLGGHYYEGVTVPANNGSHLMTILSLIWLTGIIVMLIYAFISYWNLKKKTDEGVVFKKNIWLCDRIDTPFILGVFRPRIFLPSTMDEQQIDYVVAHENAHLARHDHWWKPLGFVLLAVYWFNPLCWIAFWLLCKDIELACDEKVIKNLDVHNKKAYSEALLTCSLTRRAISVCPLAFGEVGVKDRIKTVLNYKKPAFWIITVAIVACIAVAACFLTNPAKAPVSFDNIQISRANTLDLRLNDPQTRDLSEVELSELKSWLRDLDIGRKNNDLGGFTPLYSLSIEAQGIGQFMIASYDIYGEHVGIQYDGNYYRIKDEDFIQYLSNICAGGNTTTAQEISEISLNNSYVTNSCIYMNPLSSTLYLNGDNGRRYLISENSDGGAYVTVTSKVTYEILASSSVPDPQWQPISKEEWESLFMLAEFAPDISGYREPLMMRVSDNSYLFNMDGELWFGEYGSEKNGMWSIFTLVTEQRLTLHDVIKLSQKGNSLTQTDFNKYSYIVTGSGLYIRVYEINELFSLWIGSAGSGSEPMYIYLMNNIDDNYIDIRTDDVTEFINQYRDDLLNAAISAAVLDHHSGGDSDDLIRVESHVILTTESIDASGNNQMDTVTVYTLVLYQAYNRYTYPSLDLQTVEGVHIPTALTFSVDADINYNLMEYWEPRDGSYYVPDVKAKFPEGAAENALNTQKYVDQQQQECNEKALAYLSSSENIYEEIAELFSVIESSPAVSSVPGDYIEAHPEEYSALISYGESTLCYIFLQFLKGGETGLRGHIMSIVMDDLIGDEALELYVDNGQEYFDEFLAAAERNEAQNGAEYMEKYAPASWLLLQMKSGKIT